MAGGARLMLALCLKVADRVNLGAINARRAFSARRMTLRVRPRKKLWESSSAMAASCTLSLCNTPPPRLPHLS